MPNTSPLASGGAGVDFEIEVGAIYLAALLTGGPARGATGGAVIQVTFQQRHAGAPLDDIVVQTEGGIYHGRLDLQLKRTFTFSRSDREFESVIEACWATFQRPEFQPAGARFGVAIENFPAKAKEHYARVPEWARTSTSAEQFFDRIGTPGLSSGPMREFVRRIGDYLRNRIGDAASDEALWQFFRRLVTLDFDTGIESSRDRHAALALLRSAVPSGDTYAAQKLYGELCTAVRAAAKTGGGYTAETLRERLLARGAVLGAPVSLRSDIERLQDYSSRALGGIESSIGGVVLDRDTTMQEVLDLLDRGEAALLTGPGGAGKSAILRLAASIRAQDGSVIALSGERLTGIVGWDGLASRLQLRGSLRQLILGLSGTGRPSLVVDGADRIEEEGARLAVNDILQAIAEIPPAPDGTPRWGVIVTARAEMLDTVREWIALSPRAGRITRVPELGEQEITALKVRLPHLWSVLGNPEIGPVVGNPYFLRVLEEVRTVDTHLRVATPVSEGDVLRIWWQRLVGRGGAKGIARQQAMLRLGAASLSQRTSRLIPDGIDPEVLHGLELDGILRRDPSTDTYWFGHDIVEEWTASRVLAQQSSDLLGYLNRVGEPFWAFPTLQLFGCTLLEGEDGPERWAALLTNIEADLAVDPRWREAILTAPLRSARLGTLLPKIGAVLIGQDGTRLKGFLRAVRTQAITPNPALEPVINQQPMSAEERATLLLELGWPDVAVWMPLLRWLVPQLRELPGTLSEELSRIMLIWQRATAPGFPFRREIGEVALEWRGILVDSSGQRVTVQRGAEPYFNRLREIVALSPDAVADRIPEFLNHLQQTETEHELARWIARSAQISLIQHTPEAYVDFVLDVLAPGWRDPEGAVASERAQRRAHKEFGFRDLDWRHSFSDTAFLGPSHMRGPFLPLLHAHEREGVRLIHVLVNGATARWATWDAADTTKVPLVLRFGQNPREFRGDGEVYRWFRPMGNAPYAVASALMALEVWMEQQIEGGRDPEELFEAVLRNAESVAIVAVCVAVSLAYPEICSRAAVPFVTSPSIWEYEIPRFTTDESGTFSFPGLLGPDAAERAALARDKRPQRSREIRHLVWRYLFLTELADLADSVAGAILAFPDDLSALSPAERKNPAAVAAHRSRMENFVPWGDRANYTFYQNPDGSVAGVGYEPPAQLQERNAAVREHFERMSRYLRLQNWVNKTLEVGAVAEGMSMSEAIQAAHELERPGDFTQEIVMDGDFDHARLQAIAGVAAAAVLIYPTHLEVGGHLDWCKRVLVAAAQAPRSADTLNGGYLPSDVALSAARGLMLLIRHGLADEQCRLAAFGLLRAPSKVATVVLKGVREGWECDLVFARNAVARELALATSPRRASDWHWDKREVEEKEAKERIQRIEDRFEKNVREGRLPEITMERPTEEHEFWPTHVISALRAVPEDRLKDESELGWILEVTDAVLVHVIKQAGSGEDDRRRHNLRYDLGYEWITFVGDWLAHLAGALESNEAEQHVLMPLRKSWPATAALTTEFLYSFTARRLAQQEIPDVILRRWTEVAEWMIPHEPLSAHPKAWLNRDEQEALDLLLHVHHGKPILTEVWTGAPMLANVYDRWVEVAGHTPWGFRTLATFIGAAGSHLSPLRTIGWLHATLSKVVDRERLWREGDTGTALAELLLKLWSRSAAEIRFHADTLSQLAALADDLTRAGIPLAAKLRAEVGRVPTA